MKIPFIPNQGKEEIIQKQSLHEGNIYFATDSGKIFLDTATERVTIGGGGVAIIYASAKNIVLDSVDLKYNLYLSDLDDQKAVPKKDDLIINKDGTFYKVVSFNKESKLIKCTRVAVSGSGGGGGGGGGDSPGGTPTGKYVTLTCEGTLPNAQTYIYGKKQVVKFKVEATDDAILTIKYHVTNKNTGDSKTYEFTRNNGDIHEFDLGSVLSIGQNTLIVELIGAISGNDLLTYDYITCIELGLKPGPNFNPLKYADNSDLTFSCIPVGAVKKKLKVYINDVLEVDKDLLATDSEREIFVTIPKKSHGMYNLKAEVVYSTGVIDVATNPLLYQIAFLGEGNNSPLIWFENVPTQITDHDKLNIKYMVYDPASPNRMTIRRYINNKEIAPLDNVAYSDQAWQTWNISNYQIGDNEFIIQCGSTSANVKVKVVKDELRDLNIETGNLYLNLSSNGRSNAENETQRQEWVYERSNNTKSVVKFNNFNWYNNGWLMDEETQDSMLRISNGASIEIPVSVMLGSNLDTSLTFELQFKLRNVQKYESLIEITSEEIENPTTGETEVKVTKKVKSTEGVWCKYYGNDIGFCLGTQEGFFKSLKTIVSGRYKEDEIVTVSFVVEKATDTTTFPLIYMYINGVMSSIINYDKSSDQFNNGVQNIIINSDFCDVDLYKVRVYNAALSSSQIVQNYIADWNNADLYDVNKIVSYKNNIPSIDFKAMDDYNKAHPDDALLPYAILECVDKTEDLLPFIKGGKRDVNVIFKNPALDYAYEQGLITGEQYLLGCPSYEAYNISFDVQGTSSQGYPRRNYKGKFKKSDKNSWKYTNGPLAGKEIGEENEYEGKVYKDYYMDNHYSESTFTWKADYMESSMTHNTGFTSFVKTLYSKHPLQDLNAGIDVTDRRTTIYGFPMIVFQKKKDGTLEFIGRYNYNLDKGCNNVIGFKEKTNHPYVPGEKIADVAECWELKNNQGGRCSFKVTNFNEQILNETTKRLELTVLNDFEYRYHKDDDAIDDAIKLDGDFKGSTAEEANAFIYSKYQNLEKVAEWLKSTDSTNPTNEKLVDTDGNEITYEHAGKSYTHDTAEYRIAKFAKEFSEWFDLEYCEIYFIMTEMLLQYDSRGKNMMLATWGPHREGGNYIWYPIFYDVDTQLGVNNSGVPSWDYDTEPSPFYGPGVFSTPTSVLWYNFEKCFMTPIQNKYIEIRKNSLTYEKLKGYYDYDPDVSKSYAMMGHRPINIINIDQYWKYIGPTFNGYINTSGQVAFDNGTRFYCLQGTRQLQRDLFLRNRFNYLDSKWLAGTYSEEGMTQAFMVRMNANYHPLTSDKYLDVTHSLTPEEAASGFVSAEWKQPLDTDVIFNLTPYLQQYGTLYLDETLMTGPIKWDGKNAIVLPLSETVQKSFKNDPAAQEQIVRIGGGEYISSLGDLSKFYINELNLTPLKRLKELRFGSDDPGYFNNLSIKSFALNANAKNPNGTINDYAKSLLEKVILTNINQLAGSIDVTGAEKLQEFRALKTAITGVSFADGGQMKIVHLPETVTGISFIEPVSLRGLIKSENEFTNEKGEYLPGLYIPGITSTELSKTTNITQLKIVGGNMGYSSYQLLKNLVDIKTTMQSDENIGAGKKTLSAVLEKVLWSPYKLVEAGVAKDSEKTYMLKTDNSTFKAYTPTSADWERNTLNGLVYELIPENDAEKDCLTNLNVIKKFISSDNIGAPTTDEEGKTHYPIAGTDVPNYFRDENGADGKVTTYPYLSGDIFINNAEDDKISEFEIKQIMDNYYPKLNIFVAHVDPAYTLKMVEIVEDIQTGSKKTVELKNVKYDPAQGVAYVNVEDTRITPSRLHHEFLGWSLTENGTILSDEEIGALQFSKDKMIYTLYAIFDWEYYTATFYNGNDELNERSTVQYGAYFSEPAEVPSRDADEALLNIDQRLAFYGWSDKYLSNPVASSIEQAKSWESETHVTKTRAEENKKFYAIFVQENVYDKPSNEDYFDFVLVTVNGVEGYQISAVRDLRGKITIPATHNGLPVVAIGDFTSALRATGVFFMENSMFYEVSASAFETAAQAEDIKLKGVYLPESTMYIKEKAFKGVQGLEHVSERYAKNGIAGRLSSNLVEIGQRAFENTALLRVEQIPPKVTIIPQRAFNMAGPNVVLQELPKNIARIELAAFMGCPNVRITEFGLRTNDVGFSSGLTYIGQNSFNRSGQSGSADGVNTIYIYDSVIEISRNAFSGYGNNITIYTSHPDDNIPEGWVDVGSDGSNPSALGESIIDIQGGYTGEVE